MRINFIADYFLNDVMGGGELNNHEVINILKENRHEVGQLHSHLVNPKWIEGRENFIIANFANLSKLCKNKLLNKKYVIYEHDHKYIENRNPGVYKDFLAPRDKIVNLEFYKNAKAVLCQSNLHLEIIKKNTGLGNLVNLGGNLWSQETLFYMKKISSLPKNNKHCILDSPIPHKNTHTAIKYCRVKKYDYILISDSNYYNFLKKMGLNQTFVFFPQTPETLSRVTVEARMMNMKTITNKKVGALSEPWFSLKGESLIEIMFEKRQEIGNKIIGILNE